MNQQKLCPFFNKCGGCLYQDLANSDYLSKKNAFVLRAFSDQGLTITLNPMVQIPLQSRRRASFAFQKGHLGYNALRSHQIVDITECRLLKPEIVSFLPELRQWAKILKTSGEVSILATPMGLDIHIKTTKGEAPTLSLSEQLSLLAGHPSVVRLSYNTVPILVKSPLPFPPDSFLQPSIEGEQALIHLMMGAVENEKRALDLFCGGGTFTRPLLDKGLKVIGYDCADNVSCLGMNGVKRDLFRSPLLPEEFKGTELVILDPPRSGAKAQVEQLSETKVPKIIMISCNPTTAARDAKILVDAGWILHPVTPVDQFTWSNHVEIVCLFTRDVS